MNTLLIEDEPFAAEALRLQIEKIRPGYVILCTIPTISEAVDWFKANPVPDLVFCDIHLADGSSFEIFKKVEVNSPVIFTTAYDEYAIQAFTVNSVDYLLKPIKTKALERALTKFESHRQQSSLKINDKLETLLKQVAPPSKKRFMVSSGRQLKSVPVEHIAYFISEDGVSLLVQPNNKRYVVDHTLEELEEILRGQEFFRLNRQVLCRIEAIAEVHPYFKGRLLVRLDPHTEKDQVVSSRKTPQFKEWLNQ